MEHITSKCCDAFMVPNGLSFECTRCGKLTGIVEDDVVVSVAYTEDKEAIRSVVLPGADDITLRRLAKDETCMLLDNKLCPKCKAPCRFCRDSTKAIRYVCSNCRHIIVE